MPTLPSTPHSREHRAVVGGCWFERHWFERRWFVLTLTGASATAVVGALDALLPNATEAMPIPLPVSLLAAVLAGGAALLLRWARRTPSDRRRLVLAAIVPALLCLLWVGSAILFDLLQAFGLLPAPDPGITPPPINWAGALTRVCALLTLAALASAVAAYHRLARGACMRCGRTPGKRGWNSRPSWWVALLGAVVSLPYMVLKAHWSLGGTIGLTPGSHLELTFLAGWGTIAMEGVGTFGCLALALLQCWRHRVPAAAPFVGGRFVPRWLVLVPGWSGVVLLITTGLPSLAGVVVARLSGHHVGGPLAGWVQPVVYGGWFAWGVILAAALLVYARESRAGCSCHADDVWVRR